MSCLNWLHHVAVRGCLIAAIAVFHSSALNAQEDAPEKKPEVTQTQQTQPKPDQPISITVVGPVSLEKEKAVEPDWNKLKCEAPKNHDEADLCEQRRMAKAAEDSVFLNSVQIGLGALGFFALLVTIHYSRRATHAAIIAANAADDAVKLASENAQRELRAYVSVVPTIGFGVSAGQIPEIGFTISNTGQTPAYNLRHVAIVDVLEHPLVDHQGDLALPVDGQPLPTRPLHPGAEIKGSARMDRLFTQQDEVNILTGDRYRLYLAGLVLYDDAFGIERRTQFAAYVGGLELQETIRMAKTAAQKSNPALVQMDWTFSHVHNAAT